MGSTMMPPMAAAVAVAEPEIAPKNMQAKVVTMERPPLNRPTTRLAR